MQTRWQSKSPNIYTLLWPPEVQNIPSSFHVGEHHFWQNEGGCSPVQPRCTQSLLHLGLLSNIYPQQLVLTTRQIYRSWWQKGRFIIRWHIMVNRDKFPHYGTNRGNILFSLNLCEQEEINKPVREGRWGSNIPLSIGSPLIRAALRWLTSGKSTSNTTTLSRAPSACKRKYRESKPAPSDKI